MFSPFLSFTRVFILQFVCPEVLTNLHPYWLTLDPTKVKDTLPFIPLSVTHEDVYTSNTMTTCAVHRIRTSVNLYLQTSSSLSSPDLSFYVGTVRQGPPRYSVQTKRKMYLREIYKVLSVLQEVEVG